MFFFTHSRQRRAILHHRQSEKELFAKAEVLKWSLILLKPKQSDVRSFWTNNFCKGKTPKLLVDLFELLSIQVNSEE